MIGWVNNWTYANQIPTILGAVLCHFPCYRVWQTSGGLRPHNDPSRNLRVASKEIIDFCFAPSEDLAPADYNCILGLCRRHDSYSQSDSSETLILMILFVGW